MESHAVLGGVELWGCRPVTPPRSPLRCSSPEVEVVPVQVAQPPGWQRQTVIVYASKQDDASCQQPPAIPQSQPPEPLPSPSALKQYQDKQDKQDKLTRKQWLLSIVKENFNEQMAKLVERFVSRPRHDKSVRRVPGVGRKVLVNLQDYWKRSTGQDKIMKTKDLLSVYSESGMDWKDFQKWLTKELQFMPSCAKVTALSLDIYQKYWSMQTLSKSLSNSALSKSEVK